jgi:hypothetical protein
LSRQLDDDAVGELATGVGATGAGVVIGAGVVTGASVIICGAGVGGLTGAGVLEEPSEG